MRCAGQALAVAGVKAGPIALGIPVLEFIRTLSDGRMAEQHRGRNEEGMLQLADVCHGHSSPISVMQQ